MPEGDSGTDVQLTEEELAVFAEGIKFASCVASKLLCKTIISRMFGLLAPSLADGKGISSTL